MTQTADSTMQAIESVAKRIRILHERVFVFDGAEKAHDPDAPTARHQQPRGARPSPGYPSIVTAIMDHIYEQCYTGFAGNLGQSVFVNDRTMKSKFLREMHRANASRASWSPNWKFLGEEGGRYQIEGRTGERLFVEPHNYDGPDARGLGRLRQDRSSLAQAGWYHVSGEEGLPGGEIALTRCYWNLSAQGAIPLVGALTQILNEARVPFRFKLLREPQHYLRRDSAVLYLPTHSWDHARPAIARIYNHIAPYLRQGTPLFTKALAPGLGLAEDPGNTESYGLNRSRLIAEGLWDAYEAGEDGTLEKAQAIARRFTMQGLDLERIWLRPGSSKDYSISGIRPPSLPQLVSQERDATVTA